MRQHFSKFVLVFLFGLVVIAFAIGFGATSEWTPEILWELRLPRVLLAFAVGAALSVAGMILQAVFSNPLCEPYTLGISSGATLGAVAVGSWGGILSVMGVSLPALIGALVFALFLDRLAARTKVSTVTLLLSGVMLGFVGSSLVSLWMAVMDSAGIQGALIWLLGDLSRGRTETALFSLTLVTILSVVIWSERRRLDGLLLGELNARSVGVGVESARRRFILYSSLLVAIAVSTSGMIGFIGLLVPHLTRRWVGSLHSVAIPMAFWLGGTVLILADLFARLIFRPYELPVGVVTALVGAPAFVWVLYRQKRREA